MENIGRFRDSFYYSNFMYGLLIWIVEMIGGKWWEVLVKEYIFDLLEMMLLNFVIIVDFEKFELVIGYNDDYGDFKKVFW